MPKLYEKITEKTQRWIEEQHVFFVATASGRYGHVNLSPKGHARESFRVLSPLRVAYLDLTGSGSETIAHSVWDGRITILFVALCGDPKILRLHGNATVIAKSDLSSEQLSQFHGKIVNDLGMRAMIQVEVTRISSSCGFSIPKYEFSNERETLFEWAKSKGKVNLKKYYNCWNGFSIDGLPSIAHPLISRDAPSFIVRRRRRGYWHAVNDWTLWEALREVYTLPSSILPSACKVLVPSWRDLIVGLAAALATIAFLKSDCFRS